jgi:hypothetical protein
MDGAQGRHRFGDRRQEGARRGVESPPNAATSSRLERTDALVIE